MQANLSLVYILFFPYNRFQMGCHNFFFFFLFFFCYFAVERDQPLKDCARKICSERIDENSFSFAAFFVAYRIKLPSE